MTCPCTFLLFNGDRVITLQLCIVSFVTVYPSFHRYVCFQQQCIRNTLGFATWKTGTSALMALCFSGRPKCAKRGENGWSKTSSKTSLPSSGINTEQFAMLHLWGNFGAIWLRSLQTFLGWKCSWRTCIRGPTAPALSWHREAATVMWD